QFVNLFVDGMVAPFHLQFHSCHLNPVDFVVNRFHSACTFFGIQFSGCGDICLWGRTCWSCLLPLVIRFFFLWWVLTFVRVVALSTTIPTGDIFPPPALSGPQTFRG